MHNRYERVKLSPAEKSRIKKTILVNRLKDQGKTQSEIARMLGVSRQYISQLVGHQKIKARQKIHYRLKNGIIIKPDTCEECGEAKEVEAHHTDYDEALTVTWLCTSCHGKTKRTK